MGPRRMAPVSRQRPYINRVIWCDYKLPEKRNCKFVRPQSLFQADAKLDQPGGQSLARSTREEYIHSSLPYAKLYRDSRGPLCLAEATGAACGNIIPFGISPAPIFGPKATLLCKRIVGGEDPALEKNVPSRGGTTLKKRQASS